MIDGENNKDINERKDKWDFFDNDTVCTIVTDYAFCLVVDYYSNES